MVRNYKNIFILVLIFNSCCINGISSIVADRATCGLGLICAFGSYQCLQSVPAVKNINPLFFAGASLLITGTSYLLLHSITPQGRMKRADLLLHDLSRYQLARISFNDENQFFDAVHDEHLREDLPLISAYNHFINLLPDVFLVFNLINKAATEIGDDQVLQEKHKLLLVSINKIFNNISLGLKRIRSHKDYLSQLTIYKEALYSEKQTIAQEQIALAQQQMANAQQGSALLKWLKALFKIGFR